MLVLKKGPCGPFVLLHVPLWRVWLYDSQTHNNKSEAVMKREPICPRQTCWCLLAMRAKATGHRICRRLPLDGSGFKISRRCFLELFPQSSLFEIKIPVFHGTTLLIPSYKIISHTQSARCSRAEPSSVPCEDFIKKKTVTHKPLPSWFLVRNSTFRPTMERAQCGSYK